MVGFFNRRLGVSKKVEEGVRVFFKKKNLPQATTRLNNTFFPHKNSKFEPDL
jgi:hypothetical protein